MTNLVRFDGLYVSQPLGDGSYRYFLRFYPDGRVVSASVLAIAKPEEVWVWLGEPDRANSEGTFKEHESRLSFATVFPGSIDPRDGTEFPEIRVEYTGSIEEDGSLCLQSHSLATDNRAVETYRFAAIA